MHRRQRRMEPLKQDLHTSPGNAFPALPHGGKLRREIAYQIDAVKPHHRDVLGYGQPPLLNGADRPHRHDV